jgi:hypothetical protein
MENGTMSHFDTETRGAARNPGNEEDFVKLRPGDTMQFRVTRIGKVRTVTGGANGDWKCLPFEIEARSIRDDRGATSVPTGYRWEPEAHHCEGLIDIADKLEAITGNPDAIFGHDLTVAVTTGKAKNVFHVYGYELVGPWPVKGGAVATGAPPAVTPRPAPSLAPPPVPGTNADPTPAAYAATCRAEFARCTDLAAVEVAARAAWPMAVKIGAMTEIKAEIRDARIGVVVRVFNAAPDRGALDFVWADLTPKFAADAAAMASLTAAYTAAAGAIDADVPF